MAEVRLEGVGRTFPDGTVAVAGIDLIAADGELLVLVGPSGSGKSTLLRTIAGLEAPTRGRILIGGTDVTELPPGERDVAMVFQSYALYPHMSVRANLAFGLRMRATPPDSIRERVAAAARLLDLEPLLERRPAQLSGGQRQRVALGRAIVRDPAAFLLDEPLSNLDPALRVQTRTELARLQRRLAATMIYVTHDQEEAMTLGDRVAVLRAGRLQQVAAPMELYRRPANAFVAGFVGSPAMNLLACAVERGRARVLETGLTLAAPDAPDGRAVAGIRPHDVELDVGAAAASVSGLAGVVERIEPLGGDQVVYVRLGTHEAGIDLRVAARSELAIAPGDPVALRLPEERVHWFDGATGARLGG